MVAKKWTYDVVQAEAQKYASRMAFRKGNDGAYQAAHRNGWLDSVCSGMPTVVPTAIWTEQRVAEEAAKYSSRMGFRTGSNAAYSAAVRNGWLDAVCTHMRTRRHASGHWTKDKCAAEALRYHSLSEFKKGSWSAWNAARTNGWLGALSGHMSRRTRGYWTKSRCTEEAMKYATRTEFLFGSPAAADAVYKNNWQSDVLGHFDFVTRPPWSYDECLVEAAKYSTRTEFRVNADGAYGAARRNGWLDDVCAHMGSVAGGFDPERPTILYYIRIDHPEMGVLFKVGVSNRTVAERFPWHVDMITVLKLWHFDRGHDAKEREKFVLRQFEDLRYTGKSGSVFKFGAGEREMFIEDVMSLDQGCN